MQGEQGAVAIESVRLWSVRAGLALALVGLTLGLLLAKPAMAEVQPFEVEAYSENFDVSEGLAEERLETQASGTEADIGGELEDRLGDDYAGVWFDNATGEFVVPMLSGASSQAVTSELAAADLDGDEFRTQQAQSSWEELEAAQVRIDAGWTRLFEAGKLKTQIMRTGIDTRTNAVVVSVSAAASEVEKAEIELLIGRAAVSVELREVDPERLRVSSSACTVAYRVCGLPLRGGTFIHSALPPPAGGRYCSTAFSARGNTNGKRYILTAGHCIKEPSDPSPYWSWSTYDTYYQGGYEQYIGEAEQWHYPGNDWAKIDVTGAWPDISPWPTQVAFWGHEPLLPWIPQYPWAQDLNYPIYGEASSIVGNTACHSGANTGGTCGQIMKKNETWEYDEPGEKIHGLTTVSGKYLCQEEGDSGGSIFSANMALGILSGGGVWAECYDPEKAYPEIGYTEIIAATADLGVHIEPTIVLDPPVAQTSPATNIQHEGTAFNGTVNPKGSKTTYRFEYGKTTAYGNSTPVQEGLGLGSQPVPVSINVALQPRTQYHYRIVATNAGGTSYGADQVFTTGLRWLMRNSNSTGNTEIGLWFGLPTDKKVTGDWDGNGTTTVGVYDSGTWKLRNSNATGPADVEFSFGPGEMLGAVPVSGDWDGDGDETIGFFSALSGEWKLRNSNSAGSADLSFSFGGANVLNLPATGDWDGNGTTTIGVYEPLAKTWKLRNSNNAGSSSYEFSYGSSGAVPITGDWDGNGTTTIGTFTNSNGMWKLRNSNSAGLVNVEFNFGGGTNQFTPLTGDWDGDKDSTPVLAKTEAETVNEWRLRNTNSAGNPDIAYEYGLLVGLKQVKGDWDGDGDDTPGTYDPATGVWKLRNSNTSGYQDIEFTYGGAIWVRPVVGDWDNNGTDTVGVADNSGTWRLRNSNSAGNADIEIKGFGASYSDRALAGDWNNDGTDTVGYYNPTGTWKLRATNAASSSVTEISYGGAIWTEPAVGDWDNNGTDTIGVYDLGSGTWRLRNTNSAGNADVEVAYGGGVWSPMPGDWDGDGDDTVAVVTR